MHYKQLEKILYDYRITKANIMNLEVEIETMSLPSSVTGISYDKDKINNSKISSITEDLALRKIEKEESIKKRILYLKKRMNQIDNALDCLTEVERKIVELKYIKQQQWWQIAYSVKYSETWCKRVRRIAINKMIEALRNES